MTMLAVARDPNHNIAALLEMRAAERPDQRAVVFPSSRDPSGRVAWVQLSFAQLDALTDALCAALLTPRNVEEMRALLVDLCTPAEIRTIAERWHVACLLDRSDLSYRDIHEATGVSTTTVVRVARFLRQERNHGYRRALDALGTGDAR